jgi:hypothetical protein
MLDRANSESLRIATRVAFASTIMLPITAASSRGFAVPSSAPPDEEVTSTVGGPITNRVAPRGSPAGRPVKQGILDLEDAIARAELILVVRLVEKTEAKVVHGGEQRRHLGDWITFLGHRDERLDGGQQGVGLVAEPRNRLLDADEAASVLWPHLGEEVDLLRKLQLAGFLGRHGFRGGYPYAIEHMSAPQLQDAAIEARARCRPAPSPRVRCRTSGRSASRANIRFDSCGELQIR